MEKSIVTAGFTTLGSLAGYRLAKSNEKIDRIPAMLVGGFIGNITGNLFYKAIEKPKNKISIKRKRKMLKNAKTI